MKLHKQLPGWLIAGILLLGSLPIAHADTEIEAQMEADMDMETAHFPPRPQLPKYFEWVGRYIVKDLKVNVPFVWRGDGQNMEMTAGSAKEKDPIYFTNLIYKGLLYTITYKWPEVGTPPTDPSKPLHCSCVGQFTVDKLNACLKESRFVGPEIIYKKLPRHVNHFRVTIPPFIEGDFYVDRSNPRRFWQVLHFGLQNLYDPALDEWIEIEKFGHIPKEIKLPLECKTINHVDLKKCQATNLEPVCR